MLPQSAHLDSVNRASTDLPQATILPDVDVRRLEMEARPADRGPHLQRLHLERVTNKSVGEVIKECVESNVEMERDDVRRGCGES